MMTGLLICFHVWNKGQPKHRLLEDLSLLQRASSMLAIPEQCKEKASGADRNGASRELHLWQQCGPAQLHWPGPLVDTDEMVPQAEEWTLGVWSKRNTAAPLTPGVIALQLWESRVWVVRHCCQHSRRKEQSSYLHKAAAPHRTGVTVCHYSER